MGISTFVPNSSSSKGDFFNFDENVDQPMLVNPTRLTDGIKTDYDKEGENVVLVANLVNLVTGEVMGNALMFNATVRDQLQKYIESDGEGMTVVRFAKIKTKDGKRTYNGVKPAENGDVALAEKWLRDHPTGFADRLAELEAEAKAAQVEAEKSNGSSGKSGAFKR